jgi:hypothetical protein
MAHRHAHDYAVVGEETLSWEAALKKRCIAYAVDSN